MAKADVEEFGGPKRPASAYLLFVNHNRETIANELGTKAPPAIAKSAGERWAVLGEEDKAVYQNQAKDLKEKYDAEMEKFKKTDDYQRYVEAKKEVKTAKAAKQADKRDREEAEKPKKAKRVRAEGEPKRPQTAFFLWLNAEGRAQAKVKNPSASIGEVGKIAGDIWKDMADKQQWEDKAKEAKEQYDIDMKAFKEGGAEESG
eukprot:TRINITY_DN7935_c0_g1_i1.p1 TRINITY_DN7935_c0_g1~~TRINITY_DN7935_c0_g1_i1.p1  ORF type:complete len:233 (+),score=117.72 TRINITY_DN7935_c0_g1_i1:92-700(+)